MRLLRSAAAFLLSVHAVGMVQLAFLGRTTVFGILAVTVAVAMGLTGEGPSTVSIQRDRAATYRVGSLWCIYALYVITAFMMVSSTDRQFAFVLVVLLVSSQLIFLVWPSIGPRAVPLLVNSLALCILAGARGGYLPLVSVAGYAPLAAVLIVVDHHELRRARPRETLEAALGQAGLAALVVWPLLPLLPLAGTLQGDGSSASPELSWGELADGTVGLILSAGIGLGLIFLIRWLLNRLRGEGEASAPDELEPVAEAGTAQRLSPGLEPLNLDLSGVRGDIIRIFEGFLKGAERLGFERRPNWTAAEFARRLPLPASRLARLFGRARYSEDELFEGDAAVAQADADTVLSRLRDV